MVLTGLSLLQEEVKFPSRLSEIARTILTGLLIKDPVRRLGGGPKDVGDVKAHPFFTTLNWQVSGCACDLHVTGSADVHVTSM